MLEIKGYSSNRMNYAQYMRKVAAGHTRIIGFQNGQDSSLQTHRVNARAQTVKTPVPVETSFSQIGGAKGNLLEQSQQNSSPTSAICSNGYKGVSDGRTTTNASMSVIGAAEHCAVCSDDRTNPQPVIIPCGLFITPPSSAPGQTKCCGKDMSVLYTDNAELKADQGRQSDIRKSYNLPSKLQGLRGPILTSR